MKTETPPRPILMSSIYPFISGAGIDAHRRARATLKVDCLLHERATIPGSLAVGDPFIRALVVSHLEFVRSGDLVLDLREECGTFSELAAVRYPGNAEAVRAAERFDNDSAQVLRFSARDTSLGFKARMVRHLLSLHGRSRKAAVLRALEARLDELDRSQAMFTLDDACTLGKGTHYESHVRKAARYHYCVVGGQVVNATPQVPRALWDAAGSETDDEPGDAGAGDPVALAHASVLEYFAIDLRAIDVLTPEQILELKSEGLVRQFRRELAALVTRARESAAGGPDPEIFGATKELAAEIRALVAKRIEKERGRGDWERGSAKALEETAGLFIPGLSLATSLVKHFGATRLPKSGIAAGLDRSTTPFVDYPRRIQERIVEQRRARR